MRSIAMLRIWLGLALSLVAIPVHADAPVSKSTLSVTSKRDSRDPAPKSPEASVKRTKTGVELTLHGSGSLCLATWTLHDSIVNAEANLDAPAMPSCTIVLALAPWSANEVGLQLFGAKVQRFRVP
jgi:hypothetical protein